MPSGACQPGSKRAERRLSPAGRELRGSLHSSLRLGRDKAAQPCHQSSVDSGKMMHTAGRDTLMGKLSNVALTSQHARKGSLRTGVCFPNLAGVGEVFWRVHRMPKTPERAWRIVSSSFLPAEPALEDSRGCGSCGFRDNPAQRVLDETRKGAPILDECMSPHRQAWTTDTHL